MSPKPNLHIVFIKEGGESSRELFKPGKTLEWTAPSTAKPGDVALFYVGGGDKRGIHAVGITAEDAYRAEKAAHWGAKAEGTGFFARYRQVALLDTPLSLETLRGAFPSWNRWKVLLGVRVHTVPQEFRGGLSALIVRDNPGARSHLAPFISGRVKVPSLQNPELDELRYEGSPVTRTQVVYERSSTNRSLALAAAKPPMTCVVCGFNFGRAYGSSGKGFIEVHHTKPVSAGRRKPRVADLKLLCSNCHSMAHWRSGDAPRTIKQLQKMWKANGGKRSQR